MRCFPFSLVVDDSMSSLEGKRSRQKEKRETRASTNEYLLIVADCRKTDGGIFFPIVASITARETYSKKIWKLQTRRDYDPRSSGEESRLVKMIWSSDGTAGDRGKYNFNRKEEIHRRWLAKRRGMLATSRRARPPSPPLSLRGG